MVCKRLRSLANEIAVGLSARCSEETFSSGLVGLSRVAVVERIWEICAVINIEI